MTITLNHTIVPAHDKRAAAQFFARIFGLHADAKDGHFAPVRINDTGCRGRVRSSLSKAVQALSCRNDRPCNRASSFCAKRGKNS